MCPAKFWPVPMDRTSGILRFCTGPTPSPMLWNMSFKRNGIPYRIIGGTRYFDRAEVKDMLAYLCVHEQPER